MGVAYPSQSSLAAAEVALQSIEGALVRTDAGIILYVVAKDAVQAASGPSRGPRVGRGLNKHEIEVEVSRHMELPKDFRKVCLDPVCDALRYEQYMKLKGKRYILDPDATRNNLILDKKRAQLVYALYDWVTLHPSGFQFTLDDATAACSAKITGFTKEEVSAAITALAENPAAKYFGPLGADGLLELNGNTINEERPYLDCVIRFDFKTPMTAPASSKHAGTRSPAGKKRSKKR